MPPPPIAGSNTGEAVNEANQTIASVLDKKLKEMGESIDKATQCSFGRVCSSDYVDGENQPNVGENLRMKRRRSMVVQEINSHLKIIKIRMNRMNINHQISKWLMTSI
ncbi:hypothetical protein CE143_14375 [Photorhabdus luminescens]|uniref:Uncharacterized protein n=1 Tax=Photorhabdus akhurstii TaxID=171438 RepID=A0ABX8LUK5_9GAMM|nr:hypothetical protein B0X70_14380 [Photorhabdus akhurstii]UJD76020.1 hypothetical protein CE143_14375 [Photorhabdus luminescens]